MHFIDVDGTTIHYVHNNKRSPQPALILVHGAGGRSQSWPNQWQKGFGMSNPRMRRWVTDYPVYIPDLPGHGKSDPPACDSIADYANYVIGFAQSLNLTSFVVGGHSMGAAIALDVALKRPIGLAGVIALGGGPNMVVSDLILDGLQNDFARTVDLITKFSWLKTTTSMFRETGRQHMLTSGSDVVYKDFLACSRFDVRDQLASLALPLLVIGGGQDKMMPLKFSQSLADTVPHATLDIIENAGHFMHFERTAQATKAVVAFMQSLEK